MRLAVNSTDLAILQAHRTNTLRIETQPSRFGGTFAAIVDSFGTICVCDDVAAAQAEIARATFNDLTVTTTPQHFCCTGEKV